MMVNTEFDDFIKKYIDGYLFDDLETISGIEKRKGNGAYLYIFAVCSGMEFLGALLREKSSVVGQDRKRIDTSNALAHYIGNYLIPVVDERHREGYVVFQKIAPTLVRNGLAHSYAPKGPIAVGRHGHPYGHLAFHQIYGMKQLFINADILYADFRKSYNAKVKPIIERNGSLYGRARQNYEEIRTVYSREVTEILS